MLNNGLVAYYSFNGNANDESGNGNNGTVIGATLTTDRLGNSNSAYYFNGSSSSYIDLGINPNLDRSNTSFSINTWINADLLSGPSTRAITSNRNMSNEGVMFGTTSSNGLTLTTGSPNSAGTNQQLLNTNQWYNVCITFDNLNNITKFYIDGSLVETTSTFLASLLILPSPPTHHAIGKEFSNSSNYYWKGKIDDMFLHNRVLTANEIQDIYNGTFLCSNTSNSNIVYNSGTHYVTVTDSLGCTATDSVYVHIDICGCTDSTALNYNPSATSR